jgi:hypothetical protein
VLKVIEAAEGPFRYRHGMNSAGLLFPAAAAAQSVYQGNMARTGLIDCCSVWAGLAVGALFRTGVVALTP